jgi:hypothetical protein
VVDDGVNDEEACFQACEKLEREGFWEEARRHYGMKPLKGLTNHVDRLDSSQKTKNDSGRI